jgi:prepilin-type N-terminal cleavage/methylation domain-containing protein
VKRVTLQRSQKGFTLVEMTIALAITALITGVLVSALSQTVAISWAGKKHMEAVTQVENALYYLNRDVQAASVISTTTAGYWLVITRTDGSLVNYRIVSPAHGNPVYLQRSQSGSDLVVARYIVTTDNLTRCDLQNGVLNLKVTTRLEGLGASSETRQLMVYPRLKQGE